MSFLKLKVYNVRDEEVELINHWSSQNNIDVIMTPEALTLDTLSDLADCDGIVNSQVGPLDKAVYAELENLGIKQIAQRSAGVDMYDLEEASKHHIVISNVPSYSPESIAEFTVTIALNLIRKVREIQEQIEKHNFSWTLPIRGRVLGDMTVGIIGTGRIGQATAKIFKGFGCRVIGFDLYPSSLMDGVLEYQDSVEDILKQSDVISLHMPPSADNYHLLNEKTFSLLKKDAILLNMARGALIDTEALLSALDKDQLAGAGIDTYEFEGPYIPKNLSGQKLNDPVFKALLDHPKVIYTNHIAYYTDEAVKNLIESALNASVDVINTGTTDTRVN